MNKKQSFFGNAFIYTLGVILAQGTTLITVLVLGNMMPKDSFGSMNNYGIWGQILAIIIGIQAWGSLNNARLDLGPEKLKEYSSSTFGLGIFSFGIVFVVTLVLQNFFSSLLLLPASILILCVFQGFFSYAIQHLANYYRVLNKPKQYVIWTSLVCLLRLALSVFIVYSMAENKYLGDVYGSFYANLAVGIAAAVIILVRGKRFYNKQWWKYCLAISLPFVFSGLANLILAQADKIMLSHMISLGANGTYGYVYTIANVSTAVWIAFNNSWSVWYFNKTLAGQKEQINTLFKKYCLFITFLSIVFILVCPEIVRIADWQNIYTDGIPIIPLVAAGLFFQFLYTFPVCYESFKQKTAYIAIATILAAVLNILLNLYLIPRFGGMGAAAATLAAYIFMFLFHYFVAMHIIKGFEINLVQLLIPALYVAASVALTYLFMDNWPVRWIMGLALLAFSFKVYKQSRHIMME